MTILSVNDQRKIRSGAMRSVLQKTDRILGQSRVKVQVESVEHIPAPAYTDGETITINSGMNPISNALKKGFTRKDMAIATALNYHELAHVMFTPRLNSSLASRIKNSGMFMSFNILEDQAAETRFVQRYEPARHYFTSLVANYMMENQQYLEANYVLISGRLFLPKRFRDSFRDNFHKPELIPDVDRLVTEYKTLIWPHDEDRMFDVVKEFHELLRNTNPSKPGTPHDNIGRGKPDTEQMRELKQDEEFVNDDSDESISGDLDETEEEAETGKDGGDEGEGDNESDTSSDEEGSESEPESNDAAKDGSADPHQIDEKPDPPSKEKLAEAVESAMEDALDEAIEEMEEELDNRIESVRDEERNYTVEQNVQHADTRPPSPEEMLTVSRCVDEFREVEMRRAPGWYVGQRHGKLDARRYAKALQGSRDIRKRWREGINELLDFEIVFLLDQSGSMGGSMDAASASLWILKRTFEECNGVITVLGFSNTAELLSQRFDLSSPTQVPVYGTIGSTYVADAMKEAKRILSTSIKPLRICVTISDGGFHDSHHAANEVENFDSPMVFIGIKHDVSGWNNRKNVVHTERINHPTELVGVIKNLALRLSEERVIQKGMV